MLAILRRLCLGGIILVAFASAASAGNYADPSGFSLTYPEGWFAITQNQMGDVKDALPQELKNWVTNNKIDLTRVAVVVLRDGEEEFLESVNVVVEMQQLPMNDRSLKQLTNMITQKLQASGIQINNFSANIQKVGTREAIVLEYQTQLPGVPQPLQQKQYMFPGGGKTFIVTCTATIESFEKHQPTFETILASLQIPEPIPQGFNGNNLLRFGLIGAVVGGVVVGLSKLFRKAPPKKRRRRDDDFDDDNDD